MSSNSSLATKHKVTLYTGPTGAGKTQLLCDQIASALESHALPRVVVIVPSPFLAQRFRRRLLAAAGRPFLGVEILTLSELCGSLLRSLGLPYLEIDSIVQRQLLGTVVENLLGDDLLRYYSPIAGKPGFVNVMRHFIAELKHGLIRPSEFDAVSSRRGDKDRDLGAIYVGYHQLLQEKQLADREGVMWLARDELANNPDLGAPIHLLAIDGLEQPSPLQLELVTLLSARAEATAITLTYEQGRPLLEREKRAFEALVETLHPHVVALPPADGNPDSPLRFLERHLFDVEKIEPVAGQEAVRLIEAPDRYREVKEVAREVKRLLLDGVLPGEVALLFRSLEPYISVVHQVFEEFEIPVLARGGRALTENPLVVSLLRLLSLATNDFPRRGVIATLRSPYFDFTPFGLSPSEVSELDRISRERVVISGLAIWREALELEAEGSTRGEDNGPLTSDLRERVRPLPLLEKLERFFERVTPPPEATSQEYVAFIEEIVGDDARGLQGSEVAPELWGSSGLRIVEQVLAGPFELAVRDLNALQETKEVLRSMMQAATITGRESTSWKDFLAEFRNALNSSSYALHKSSAGRVVAQEVHQARGRTYRYAFLVGLSEGEFPRSTPVDILYNQEEREELRAAGLRVESKPQGDEPYLFYQAVTRARDRLYASYYYLDDEGREVPPSPYLREIARLLTIDPPVRVRLGSSASLDQAASSAEFCIAAVEALQENNRSGLAAHNSLVTLPAWHTALRGRELELRRQSPGMFGPFDGVLVSPDILATLQREYDQRHAWSAAALSEYGTCPFKFFAHRLLSLEEPKEPEVGLDALQLGSIYHTILEGIFRVLIDEDIIVDFDRLNEVLEIARRVGAEILESAPRDRGFRPTALWELEKEEILGNVKRLIAAEAEYNAKEGTRFIPIMTEAPFGRGDMPALFVDGPAERVIVSGYIDRVDRSSQGLRVVDYKTGRAPPRKEIEEGRDLQLPIYVLAVENALLPEEEVVEAFYYSISAARRSTLLSSTKKGEPNPEWQEMLDLSRKRVHDYVERARAGLFPVFPTGDCPSYCDFADICRKKLTSERKKLPSESVDA